MSKELLEFLHKIGAIVSHIYDKETKVTTVKLVTPKVNEAFIGCSLEEVVEKVKNYV